MRLNAWHSTVASSIHESQSTAFERMCAGARVAAPRTSVSSACAPGGRIVLLLAEAQALPLQKAATLAESNNQRVLTRGVWYGGHVWRKDRRILGSACVYDLAVVAHDRDIGESRD